MTAVFAYHPAEGDRPTTAQLLDALCVQAETTRRAPDRIVADLILTALDESTCPECGWPTHEGRDYVGCVHCPWWWAL